MSWGLYLFCRYRLDTDTPRVLISACPCNIHKKGPKQIQRRRPWCFRSGQQLASHSLLIMHQIETGATILQVPDASWNEPSWKNQKSQWERLCSRPKKKTIQVKSFSSSSYLSECQKQSSQSAEKYIKDNTKTAANPNWNLYCGAFCNVVMKQWTAMLSHVLSKCQRRSSTHHVNRKG